MSETYDEIVFTSPKEDFHRLLMTYKHSKAKHVPPALKVTQ